MKTINRIHCFGAKAKLLFFFLLFVFFMLGYHSSVLAQSTFFTTFSYWEPNPDDWLAIPDEPGRCVRETQDGNYLLLGLSEDDLVYTKVDESGQHLWSKRFSVPDNSIFAEQYIELTNGDLLLTGSIYNVADSHRTITIRCDADGNLIWSKMYLGGPITMTLCELNNGNIIVSGQGSRYFIIDGLGDVVSSFGIRELGGFDNGFDNSKATEDGGAILVGSASFGGLGFQMTAAKIDANGNVEWHRHYGGEDFDYGGGVDFAENGGYLFSGYTRSFGSDPNESFDNLLVKVDANGDVIWSKAYGTNENEYSRGCTLADDGGYVMAGWVGEGFECELQIIKSNATGDLQWVRRYNHREQDGASFIEKTSDSGFILTGGGVNTFPWTPDHYLTKTDSYGLISENCHTSPEYNTYDLNIPMGESDLIIDDTLNGQDLNVIIEDECPDMLIVCGESTDYSLGDETACVNGQLELLFESDLGGEYLYQWFFNGEMISGETSNALVLENITEADAGQYTLEVNSGECDSFTAVSNVVVDDCSCITPPFEIGIINPAACCGESISINILDLDLGIEPDAVFSWQILDAELVSGDLDVNNPIEILPDNCGENSQISLTITNPDCLPTERVLEISSPALLELSVNISPNCGNCSGGITLEGLGGTPDYLYSLDGGVPLGQNQYSDMCEGFYSIEMSDSNGCLTHEDFELANVEFPESLVDSEINICEGAKFTLEIEDDPNFQYNWSNGDQGASSTFTTPGEYSLIVSYQDCSRNYPFQVNEINNPIIDIIVEGDLCDPEQIGVSLIAESNGQVEWLHENWQGEVELVVFEPGVYSVSSVNSANCVAQNEIEVTSNCLPVVYIPNAFTPNGDGINEVFQVASSFQLEDYHLTIYNRWGEQIFESYSQSSSWVGNFENGEYYVPNGIYTWVLTYSSQGSIGSRNIMESTGSVKLIR